MRKILVMALLLIPFGLSQDSWGGPVRSSKPLINVEVNPFGSKTFVKTFKAHESASVIAVGNGSTYLGLYVFDEHGNCVCKDDDGVTFNLDDCAVEWFPSREQKYLIEVRNLGALTNKFQITFR